MNYHADARPADKHAADLTEPGEIALRNDFGSCFYIWHSDQWRVSGKHSFGWGYAADTAVDLRKQLDVAMASAIPAIRAQLKTAEAAAERLRRRQ